MSRAERPVIACISWAAPEAFKCMHNAASWMAVTIYLAIAQCRPAVCRYGLDFTPEGTACYGTLSDIHWDKRDYTTLYPPRNATWPPSIQHTAARKHLELIAEAAAHLEHWHDRFDPPP